MAKFRLIQRGTFRKSGKYFTGKEGVLDLEYMGSSEFEFGAIPKAFKRLMYHFLNYEVFSTGIYTPEHDELLVFCRKEFAEEIIQLVQQYIQKPYQLKEYSGLDKIPKGKGDQKYDCLNSTNFWWCIDIKSYGDWMAFLQPQSELLVNSLKNDYEDWWVKKDAQTREADYRESLHW